MSLQSLVSLGFDFFVLSQFSADAFGAVSTSVLCPFSVRGVMCRFV